MGKREIEKMKDFSLTDELNIKEKAVDLVTCCEEKVIDSFKEIDERTLIFQSRILKAFQNNRISDAHFSWATGYGYDDLGRDGLEKVYADVFKAEKALVRTNIVNGTHAIALGMLGVLREGDSLLYITGIPYDTMQTVIGFSDNQGKKDGTLRDYGIKYDSIELKNNCIDLEELAKIMKISPPTMVAIQRSTGYGWRNPITVNQIAEAAELIKKYNPETLILVDNCYCEFVELQEPSEVGIDIVCGSLIKNPGGGLALSGGYVLGRSDLIDMIAYRLTCPGIGQECGLTYGQTRNMLQGLFMAPHVTAGALKGAILCGAVYKELGYDIIPEVDDPRADIIQAIRLKSEAAVTSFCTGIQRAAPVDSYLSPVASPMPGYKDKIIMAAGTFVQGASIELSADAPIRPPYNVYFQGGLTYEHSKLGILYSLNNMLNDGLIDL